MRVHHLNCATMCPRGGALLGGSGGPWNKARLVCHCLLVETRDGLVLVDTGLGLDDLASPRTRLGGPFLTFARPLCDPKECAVRQVEALGFRAGDVRHVVVTHLDVDHAGGLPDFPEATVHLHAKEHAAALARATRNERERYRPAQWAHGARFKTYEEAGERWFGFEAVRALGGTDDGVLLVPLHGHTRGHSAVAVQGDDGWLLHCGDAYFAHGELDATNPRCPPALAAFQRILSMDEAARVANQARLRELARDHAREVRLFCAHSADELDALAGRAA